MRTLATKVHLFVQEQRGSGDEGAVSAEYGVLLAGIVAVVAVAATALGGRIADIFEAVLP